METTTDKINHKTSFALSVLKNIYFQRHAKNPSYSLRAYAKSLGVSHTLLSLLFSGKRPLTENIAGRLVDKVDLSAQHRELFFSEFKSKGKGSSHISKEELNHLKLEAFNFISEWQHYAILSLLQTVDFKMDSAWIAKRLKVGKLVVENSLERLKKLELIEFKDGKWRQRGGDIRLDNKNSSAATRRYNRQLLQKAIYSLLNDPIEIRNHSSMTFAMDPKSIPYAKEKIREFRLQLAAELSNIGEMKEVYNLTVQIFPVTEEVNK